MASSKEKLFLGHSHKSYASTTDHVKVVIKMNWISTLTLQLTLMHIKSCGTLQVHSDDYKGYVTTSYSAN